MIRSVYEVTDIVHMRGDLGKLDIMLRVSKLGEYILDACRNTPDVRKAVLCVAESRKRFVRTLDIRIYCLIVFYAEVLLPAGELKLIAPAIIAAASLSRPSSL